MSASLNVVPVSFQEADVGKRIKATKRSLKWTFKIEDGAEHVIEMFYSKLSGKKAVIFDGDKIYEGKQMSQFRYALIVEKQNIFVITDKNHGYDLEINNGVRFQQLLKGKASSDFDKWAAKANDKIV